MKRILCIILLFSMAISFTACETSPADKENNGRKLSLTLESVDAVYSDELCSAVSDRFLSSVEKILYKAEGFRLSDAEKQKISVYIKEKALPAFKEVPVYAGELERLCEYAEKLAENYGETNLYFVYTELISFLGSERSSALCYNLTILYLEYLRDDFAEKYNQTSYPWHLAEYEKCSEMLNELTNVLGKEKFSSSLDLFAFCASLTSGMLLSESRENNAYNISGGELNMLLRRHAKALSKTEISDAEWKIFARIAEYITQRNLKLDDPVCNAVALALIDNSFFEGISVTSNEFIAFYKSFTEKLTADSCDIIINGNASERSRAVCRVLTECRDTLSPFLKALEDNALPSADIARSSLIACGYGDKYDEFTKSVTPVSSDELIGAIQEYASSDSDDHTAFDRAVISYIYGISPCLAFSVSEALAKTQ